jgi:pimeloyl-ACP methyl ester carboxylesterase
MADQGGSLEDLDAGAARSSRRWRLAAPDVRYIGIGSRRGARCATHAAPVAAIWGAADRVAPLEIAEALRAARPSLRVTPLEGVGHFPMLEAPSLVTEALKRHLADWTGAQL